MTMEKSARDRILKIYAILKECDQSSPMTNEGIRDTLEQEYGIQVSERTLDDDMKTLRENGLVRKVGQKGTKKSERGAYGLFDNDYFDLWEIKIMLDSISQIPYIPLDTVERIRAKMLNLTKQDIRERAEKLVSQLPEQMYSADEEFIETFKDAITAVLGKRVVEFRYSRLGPDKKYVEDKDYAQIVHPYAITTLDDYFYLIGYYEQRETLTPFRLDRIKSIKVTDRPATPAARLPIGDKTEDIKNYVVNNTSNFMHAKKEMLTVRWHPEVTHVSLLYDIMGAANVTKMRGENEYMIRTDMNRGLIANLLRLGPAVELTGPSSKASKKAFLDELRQVTAYYKDEL